jgi:anion-transporting  ArsA/GET3 family ATPase
VLGLQFLQDLSEFFLAFESMYAGFKQRAESVYELLRAPDTGFLVVAAPRAASLDEARHFHARLREKAMPFVSFIVNRVHTAPPSSVRTGRKKAEPPDAELRERLLEVHGQQQALAQLDRRAIARLKTGARADVVAVPELESDVHDLRGLRDVAEALFGSALQPSALRLPARA